MVHTCTPPHTHMHGHTTHTRTHTRTHTHQFRDTSECNLRQSSHLQDNSREDHTPDTTTNLPIITLNTLIRKGGMLPPPRSTSVHNGQSDAMYDFGRPTTL